MVSETAAKQWLRDEIFTEAKRAKNSPHEPTRMFAEGCVDAYVRAAVHLELGSLHEWRAIAESAMESATVPRP